jgi:hypothetical protein
MKKALVFALLAAVSVIVASCASAPAKPMEKQQGTAPMTAASLPEAELASARELQQKADAFHLGDFAPEEYAAGKSALAAGQDSYGKNNAASRKSLDQAAASFTAVIDKGGKAYLAKAKAEADTSRKAADDLKASAAIQLSAASSREKYIAYEYGKAQEAYDKAGKEGEAGDLGAAGKDYAAARSGFTAAAASAQVKKDRAVRALAETERAMTASEKNAEDAQKSLRDEGFTSSGAQ